MAQRGIRNDAFQNFLKFIPQFVSDIKKITTFAAANATDSTPKKSVCFLIANH